MATTLGMAAVCTLISACATSASTKAANEATDDSLLASLEDGTAELATLGAFSGYAEAFSEGLKVRNFCGLYDTRNWSQLALEVIRTGSGSDVGWFYLGRSAEELGHPHAARIYYQRSVEAAAHKGISGCLGVGCCGLDFPEDSLRRLDELNKKSVLEQEINGRESK